MQANMAEADVDVNTLTQYNKMEYKCEECNRNFNSKGSLDQHNSMKHSNQNDQNNRNDQTNQKNNKNEKGKISFKKYFIWTAVILIVVLIGLSINAQGKKPGKFDEFAKCLTDKGIIVYGNDYCSYTTKQLGFFGKSQKILNYVKCIDNEALCNEKGVDITPTWEIGGVMYSGVKTFEALAGYSGCEI